MVSKVNKCLFILMWHKILVILLQMFWMWVSNWRKESKVTPRFFAVEMNVMVERSMVSDLESLAILFILCLLAIGMICVLAELSFKPMDVK